MSYQEYTVKVFNDGTREWFQNGKYHRDDGPAIECVNGTKEWYQNDKLHRTDGPAIECVNGTKEWYQNDKLHRTDGPAIEYANGNKEWHLEGVEYTEEEFKKKTSSSSCEGKIVEIEGHKYKLMSV